MKQGARVHFHAGTAETIAEVFFHGQKEVPPGGSALANLKMQDEVLVLPGDRFIVRQFSPVVTIGGGAVLDPLARRPMLRDTGRAAFLETIERQNGDETLAAMTERALLGLGYEEIVARTGWTEKEIQGALGKLHGTGRVRTVSSEPLVLVSGKLFEEVRKRITEKVERFQKENPGNPARRFARQPRQARAHRNVSRRARRIGSAEKIGRAGRIGEKSRL
jgi:selenocysteine-specific elongation factor